MHYLIGLIGTIIVGYYTLMPVVLIVGCVVYLVLGLFAVICACVFSLFYVLALALFSTSTDKVDVFLFFWKIKIPEKQADELCSNLDFEMCEFSWPGGFLVKETEYKCQCGAIFDDGSITCPHCGCSRFYSQRHNRYHLSGFAIVVTLSIILLIVYALLRGFYAFLHSLLASLL